MKLLISYIGDYTLEGLTPEEIAQSEGKKRNAAHVAQAVREIKQLPSSAAEEARTRIIPNQQEQPEPPPIAVEPELERRAEYQSSPLNTDDRPDPSEICIDLISNIPLFEDEQLRQLIKDAEQIIRDAEQELNQRQCL